VFSCDVIEFVSAVLNEGRVNFEWTDASLGIIVGVRFFLSLSLILCKRKQPIFNVYRNK
jgi:hypothetical protein